MLPPAGYSILTENVNNNGDVAGFGTTSGSNLRAALLWKRIPGGWSPPQEMGEWTPRGMNNVGAVVGSGNGEGVVWSESAGLIPLAGQGVYDANDGGKLSGHDSPGRAVIWVPAP
jgi:hypothetical protein